MNPTKTEGRIKVSDLIEALEKVNQDLPVVISTSKIKLDPQVQQIKGSSTSPLIAVAESTEEPENIIDGEILEKEKNTVVLIPLACITHEPEQVTYQRKKEFTDEN